MTSATTTNLPPACAVGIDVSKAHLDLVGARFRRESAAHRDARAAARRR